MGWPLQPSLLSHVFLELLMYELLIHHDFLLPKSDHKHAKCYIPVEMYIANQKICAGQAL